jgi:NADH-quinone oxidoreductase subunit C
VIPSEKTKESSRELLEILVGKFPQVVKAAEVSLGDAVVVIEVGDLKQFMLQLRDDSDLAFAVLLSVTAVDWMDGRDERFEVVYHLLSLKLNARLRVKIALSEDKPEVSSVTGVWNSADFMERECWDMYGIVFTGHPNLTRILMYDEFKGHPLRKDYPLQAKQPRIPLRAPEVKNTAVDMQRASLVQITRKERAHGSGRVDAHESETRF